MDSNVKWRKYLGVSLLLFAAFLLEYFALFVIEMLIMRMNIWDYTANQRSVHHLIMVIIWTLYLCFIIFYSRKHYDFPQKKEKTNISTKNWVVAASCLILCKIMTFIDWHTLKIIGELHGKSVFQFISQYLYYIFEVVLVVLIIIYGQKAIETLLKKESLIPFGGIILAMTWGAFHFVSRGVGLEIWNGISTIGRGHRL